MHKVREDCREKGLAGIDWIQMFKDQMMALCESSVGYNSGISVVKSFYVQAIVTSSEYRGKNGIERYLKFFFRSFYQNKRYKYILHRQERN